MVTYTFDRDKTIVMTSTVIPSGTVVHTQPYTYTWKINNINQNSNTPNLTINTINNLNEGKNTISLVVVCEHGTVSNEYIAEFDIQTPIPPIPQGDNLILNPSFENGITVPLNWTLVSANNNTPIWDNTTFHTGTKSVKISVPGTANVVSGYPESDKVEVLPNTTYIASVWGKTENCGGSNTPAARFVEFDENNNFLKQTNILPVFNKGTNDWQQRKQEITTTPSTKYINIYANIWNGYGNFWLDDVSLIPKETTPPVEIWNDTCVIPLNGLEISNLGNTRPNPKCNPPIPTTNPVRIKVDKTIIITVIDEATNLPVSNINVESNGETKVTDSEGKVIFN